MNVGVVQLIGQAIRKRKLTQPKDKTVAIGVCNYGCVKNLSDFQRLEHAQKSPSLTSVETGAQNVEMNHTHFILLDDGTLRRYSTGDYRTRLAQSIARRRGKDHLPGQTKNSSINRRWFIGVFFSSHGHTALRRGRRFDSVDLSRSSTEHSDHHRQCK